jgi:hypothetical protein
MRSLAKVSILAVCIAAIMVSFAWAADANAPAKEVKSPAKSDVNAPKQATDASGMIFKEDFEDRLTDRGWTVSNGDYDYVWDTTANEGKKSVKIKYASWIQKAISTAGYKDIKVKYACKVTNFDKNENLAVEWSADGTTWNNLEKATDADWAVKEFPLGPEADNKTGFRIKFKTNARGDTDKYASVDALEITGTPTGEKPKPASAPADANKPKK